MEGSDEPAAPSSWLTHAGVACWAEKWGRVSTSRGDRRGLMEGSDETAAPSSWLTRTGMVMDLLRWGWISKG